LTVFIALSGSGRAKAARKTLVKLAQGVLETCESYMAFKKG